MNRLTYPIVARTLSGAVLSPCSDAGGNHVPSRAGRQTGRPEPTADPPPLEAPAPWSPPLDAPADLNLHGLIRSLRWLVLELGPLPAALVDVGVMEKRATPLELCRWMDELSERADRISSTAMMLREVCDVIWGQASDVARARREAELEMARTG